MAYMMDAIIRLFFALVFAVPPVLLPAGHAATIDVCREPTPHGPVRVRVSSEDLGDMIVIRRVRHDAPPGFVVLNGDGTHNVVMYGGKRIKGPHWGTAHNPDVIHRDVILHGDGRRAVRYNALYTWTDEPILTRVRVTCWIGR